MANDCPDCEVKLVKGRCPSCGWQGRSGDDAPKIPSLCPADGGRLQADGWCETGQGYLAHMSCPFACPICRHPLGWSGECHACHGTTTAKREDWTFPGDRYELAGGHWQHVLTGERKACSMAENVIEARKVTAILAKSTLAKTVGEPEPRMRDALLEARKQARTLTEAAKA